VVDGPKHEEHCGLPEGETEEIDAIPVPANEGQVITPLHSVPAPRHAVSGSFASLRYVPAVQAAAVAAGGFVAGAAVVGLARRRRLDSRASRLGVRERGGRGHRRSAGELLQIVGSRSVLLDIHLLGSAGSRR
jgi:hypothetical protein